jgi:hypothetical protein
MAGAFFVALLAVLALLVAQRRPRAPAETAGAGVSAFDVTLTRTALDSAAALGLETPLQGRLFVIVTRDTTEEPRLQTGVTGVPFWGRDVGEVGAGDRITLADGSDIFGYPLARISDLPAGDYVVQALLNVYTTFRRADGKVVAMHNETGEGQDLWRSPGNPISPPVRVHIGNGDSLRVALELSNVIPPIEPVPAGGVPQQGNPQDGRLVKFVKIRSEKVSAFWGRDMWIGANVLLPRDYDQRPNERYPVIYVQGHFPGRAAPFGFTEDSSRSGPAAEFSRFWLSDAAPRLIVVTIRDANPYYDTSYSVNSANVGPWGDAIVEELIPHLERTFRIDASPGARLLAGGSTGGWEALAMQIFYPDSFGGAWGWCPDPVDFRYHQIVNVYDDANAYVTDHGWVQVERPGNRRPDGNVRYTMRQENLYEYAAGPRGRSGGQWAIWEAVFSPVAEDGYAQPIWDPITGVIDKNVAAWWREHFDLNQILQRDWSRLGPKLQGKLHIAIGDMDSYYLEQAVYLLEEFLNTTKSPPANATIEYGRKQPHCWTGSSPERPGERLSNAEFVRVAATYLAARRAR